MSLCPFYLIFKYILFNTKNITQKISMNKNISIININKITNNTKNHTPLFKNCKKNIYPPAPHILIKGEVTLKIKKDLLI